MSTHSDFRDVLIAHAPLTALVGTRIAVNALPDGAGMPCIVFGGAGTPVYDALGSELGRRTALSVQCWAETAAEADAVADAVFGAVATAVATHAAQVQDRGGAYDDELGLDAVTLTVDWWD